MADPQTPEEWLLLAKRAESVAKTMQNSREHAAEAQTQSGYAVEYALKAYIMRRERLNGWPDKNLRPDLYVHDLRKLAEVATINFRAEPKLRPAWLLLVQWQRSQAYDPKRMPRRVAEQWVEAAFGANGIVTWIRANLM